MRKILFLVVAFLTFASRVSALGGEDAMINSVLKLKVYEKDSVTGNYTFLQWGSAVALDNKRIVTNAHVILDSIEKPTGYYELCRFEAKKDDPVCFTVAKLVSYDAVSDLALLEASSAIPSVKKITYSEKSLSIGSSAIAYGYPAIGGTNITRTEGKIGGKEADKYKFDGTIDHGNSGGGAFDTDGRLIGIPYAVSSDNGVIGYIIPVKSLTDFLAGKTSNIEKYTSPNTTEFTAYIRRIEALAKNPNLLKTKYLEVKNLGKLGLSLKSTVESIDGRIFDYRWSDKNTRTALIIGCSNDASSGKNIISFREQEQKNTIRNPNFTSTASYMDTSNTIYTTTAIRTKPVNGQTAGVKEFLFTSAPTCNMTLVVDDVKKDQALFDKASTIASSLRFTSSIPLTTTFTSPSFRLSTLPSNVYVSESTSFSDTSIVPHILFQFGKESKTASDFFRATYENRDELMSLYADNYTGTDYSFQKFYERYRSVGDSSILEETVLETKNGKKMIFTVINSTKGQKDSDGGLEKVKILAFYPFKSKDGKYHSYTIGFSLLSSDMGNVEAIREVLRDLELPGETPFD